MAMKIEEQQKRIEKLLRDETFVAGFCHQFESGCYRLVFRDVNRSIAGDTIPKEAEIVCRDVIAGFITRRRAELQAERAAIEESVQTPGE